jgi:hypothetical protein
VTRRGILVAAAFAAAVYVSWLHDPVRKGLSFDNQVYYYIADQVADGVPPHVSLVEHKHQLPTLMSGFAMRAARAFGGDELLAMRVVSIAMAGVMTASTAWVAAELAGLGAGLIAACAMLALPGMYSQAAMGVRPQVFMAAFMMLSLVAFGRRRRFAAGVAATCAFLCWTPAALVGVALVIAALFGRDRWRAIVGLAAGAITAILVYESYYVWYGALAEQVRQSYLMAGELSHYSYPKLADSLAFFTRFGIGWRQDSSIVLSSLFLVSLAVVPLAVLALRKRALDAAGSIPAWPATIVCAYFTTALTLLTHEGYPDMFFCEPLIAVGAGVVLGGAASLLARVSRIRLVEVAAVAACVVWLGVLYQHRRTVFPTGGIHIADQRELAKQLDIIADDYGTVWAVGCPHLLAFSHRQNFLPFGLLIDLKVREYMLKGASPATYLPLRDGRLPGAILASRGGLRVVLPWLNREYRRVDNKSFAAQGIQVWLRRPPRPGDPRSRGSLRQTLG